MFDTFIRLDSPLSFVRVGPDFSKSGLRGRMQKNFLNGVVGHERCGVWKMFEMQKIAE